MQSKHLKIFQKKLKEKDVELTLKECNILSDAFIETMIDIVGDGKDLELKRFGIFYSKPVQSFNPKNRKPIGLRFNIYFKTSTILKSIINEKIKK